MIISYQFSQLACQIHCEPESISNCTVTSEIYFDDPLVDIHMLLLMFIILRVKILLNEL